MKDIITKGYSRKLSANYSSEEFTTRIEREVEYANKEEYIIVTDKLAAQVKALTLRDIEKHSELLRISKEPVMAEDKTS